MINWEAMREAIAAGVVIVCFAAVMTFVVIYALNLAGVDMSKKCSCTCTCHVMEGISHVE